MNAQRGLRLAGSCQSPVSNGISKPRQVPSEDSRASPAWLGDTPRGTKPARKEPRPEAPPPRQHAALRDKAAELLGPGSTVTLE